MRQRLRSLGVLLCVAMLAGMLSSCNGGASSAENENSGTKNGKKKIKDTLTVALYEEPSALDPQASSLSGNAQVCMQIYDTLLKKNQTTGTLEPSLAKSWEKIDDLTYRFHLREDACFHNGKPLTSDDVVYSIQRLTTAPATKSRYTSVDAANTKAVDKYTVDLKLSQPWGKVLLYFTTGLSSVVCKEVAGDSTSNMARNPVGTGPYEFVSWTTGDSIVLKASDKYWGPKPVTANLVFRFFPDSSIRAIQVESGEVDFMFSIGSQDYARLSSDKNLVVSAGPGYTHESMYFSQACKSVYNDARVREALTYALDMPAVVQATWGDLAVPADSIYSSELEGHVSIGPVKQDLARAKRLLAEAGHPNGLNCEMYVPNNSTTLTYLEICQNMWAEAGIKMTINSLDSASVKQMNAKGTNPFGRSNFTASTGDPVHALAAWEIGYTGVMQPRDKHIDDLIKKTRASSDEAECAKYLEEIQHYALDKMYYAIPVAFIKVSYAMSANLFGFEFSPGEVVYFSQIGVNED